MATLYELQQGLVRAHNAGAKEDAQSIADAIRQHPTFQKQSQEKLEMGFKALDKDERRAQIQKHTARALGLKDSEIDFNKGMGGWDRFKLGLLRDEESKFEELEKRFGRENLNVVNIGGRQNILYRDPSEEKSKWRLVDEQGFSLADIADLSGAVAPTVGAIAGGVKGAATGAAIGAAAGGVGALPGAIIGGVGGAALGGFAAGTAQDIATEIATGQEVDVGEITAQRGKEAVLGAGLDVAMLGTGRFVAKPLMKVVGKTDVAKGLMGRVDKLRQRGVADFETLPAMTKTEGAIEKAGRRAGETGGALTRAMQKNLDEANRAMRVMAGEAPPTTPDEALFRMQQNIRNEYADTTAQYNALGKQAVEALQANQRVSAEAVQQQLDSELAGLRPARDFDPELAANNLRQAVIRQRDMVAEASGQKFDEALNSLESVAVSASRVQRELGEAVDILKGVEAEDALIAGLSASKVAQISKSANKLDALVEAGESIPFRNLHNLKKSLDDAAGWGSLSRTENQRAAGRAAGRIRKLLEEKASEAGLKGKKYAEANTFFQERVTPFRTKQIAPMLAEDVAPGTFKETGEKLANRMVGDAETTRQILDAAGGLRPIVKKELQQQYLSVIGDGKTFNKRIVKMLFGEDKLKSLERIKELRKKADVKAETVTEADIERLVGSLTGKTRQQVEKAIADRIKLQQRADALLKRNKVIAKIAKGEAPMPSDPRNFANNVLKETDPDVIRDFVSKMDDAERSSFQAGVTHEMLNKAGFGGDAAARTSIASGEVPMWKLGDIEKELMRKEAKYRAALGDDVFDDWVALDQVAKANAITGTPIKEQLRAVFTTGSGILIVAAGIPKWAYGRVMNAMTGSKLLRPWLRNVEADISQLQNALPFLLGSSRGIEALLVEARQDPDFAEFIENELAAQAQKQGGETISTGE